MDNRLLLIGSALVVAVFLLGGSSLFSFSVSDTPRMDDCPPDSETGDLRCSVDNEGDSTIRSEFFDVSAVEVSGERYSPVSVWLYRNGFVKDSAEIEDFDDLTISNLEYGGDVQESLESASMCRVRISDLTSDSSTSFVVDGTKEMRWEDDDDWDDEAPSIEQLSFEPFWVSGSVEVNSNGQVACTGLDYKTVIERVDNRFSGEVTSIRNTGFSFPDTESPGMTLDVSFEVDSDGDGVIDSRDAYPENSDHSTVRDSDGDGVVDVDDVAPNEPGSNVDGSPTLLEGLVHDLGLSGWLQPDFVPRF